MTYDKYRVDFGDTRPWGSQTQIFTEKGWVIVDSLKEADEEIERMIKEGVMEHD
jgi:hypothetical protein